jgi:hypothetical protein
MELHDKNLEEARAARRARARAAAADTVAKLEARTPAEVERDRCAAALRGLVFRGVGRVEALLPEAREGGGWTYYAEEPESGRTYRVEFRYGPRGGNYTSLVEKWS